MDFFKPVKPDTIAKSLAIGTPADGFYALKVMKETGGASDDVTDDEIREAMSALAECEGIFTETAGGVTVGVPRNWLPQARFLPRIPSCSASPAMASKRSMPYRGMSVSRLRSSRACASLSN